MAKIVLFCAKQNFLVNFKCISMVIAIKWPSRNLLDFVQNFLIDACFQNQNIVSESISNRAAIRSALKQNKVLLTYYSGGCFLR